MNKNDIPDIKVPKVDPKPTDEELAARLEKLAVKGSWQDPPLPEGGDIPLGETLSYYKKTVAALEGLQQLLEHQIKTDLKQIDSLREKADRLKHGGGV